MKTVDVIRAFTAFSTVQFIGYLGAAYPVLRYSMIIIVLLLIALQLVEAVIRWANAQGRVNHVLSKPQILSAIAPSLVVLGFVLIAVAVGSWIAS